MSYFKSTAKFGMATHAATGRFTGGRSRTQLLDPTFHGPNLSALNAHIHTFHDQLASPAT